MGDGVVGAALSLAASAASGAESRAGLRREKSDGGFGMGELAAKLPSRLFKSEGDCF